MDLPLPDAAALAHSQRLSAFLAEEIARQGGWMPFSRYMELALYAPGLGYYTAGARKFGAAGDFVTAPELTPLFAQTLANQILPILEASAPVILEAGAGSGRLAADLLLALEARGQLPDQYLILELSPDLKERQAATLAQAAPHLADRVQWLERLPDSFAGVILGNEVLDAMPVELVRWQGDGVDQQGVTWSDTTGFAWAGRPATEELARVARNLAAEVGLAPEATGPGYTSEIGLAAAAWTAAWGPILQQGALLLLDYGFPRREFYHPQRHQGTLMCHYRHQAHGEPFSYPGLTDITAHVDFTAVAEGGFQAGLEVAGYTSQGQFLLNCGLLEQLAALDPEQPDYFRAAAAVQKLVQPQEMGELFKVIALTKGLTAPLLGFARGDRSHTL